MVDAPPDGRLRRSLRNGLRLLRKQRVGSAYGAPFEIVQQDATVALRCYSPAAHGQRALLLVPPLMVTSQIYDIAPELSAVAFLSRHGVPTYVADFGAPEDQDGGLDRTLDDHILAVSRCIDHLVAITGQDVHLVGYSQGGMFCYQVAAYRKSQGIASLVTFGAPVDIRRNVPFKLNDKVAATLIDGLRRAIGRPLEGLRAIPGTLSSRGFKLLAPLQELRHLAQLMTVLHDEEALARLEPKRRFLGGEGFTAWPGPALRTFIDEFVVGNRMKQGGFVIAGKTVALADITSPICYVVGEQDDLALPEAVRAIKDAAPRAASYPVHVAAGHFGLVVGRAALSECWPTVVAWVAWRDGRGDRPAILDNAAQASQQRGPHGQSGEGVPADDASFIDTVTADAWDRLGQVGVRVGRWLDVLRWQAPRIVRRARLDQADDASVAALLRERAQQVPDEIAFLFAGRAYSLAEADARVDALVQALTAKGIARGQRVPVVARATPDSITALVALDRIGASAEPIAHVHPRAWLKAGYDIAIDHRITGADTLYAPSTLSAEGLALAVAGALVGGARLQLGRGQPSWEELMNSGATIVLADDETARALADAPIPERHVVRLVLGVALSSEIAALVTDRMGRRTRYRALQELK